MMSARSEFPFVPVNCGAIPSELMESEFFGHKKGSFTGAVSDKLGLFQAADGGTLFIDSVGDLQPAQGLVHIGVVVERRDFRLAPAPAPAVFPLGVVALDLGGIRQHELQQIGRRSGGVNGT